MCSPAAASSRGVPVCLETRRFQAAPGAVPGFLAAVGNERRGSGFPAPSRRSAGRCPPLQHLELPAERLCRGADIEVDEGSGSGQTRGT